MTLSCKVGGARETFEARYGTEVAGALDSAFGAEDEWEGATPIGFGDLTASSWEEFQDRAVAELGADALPNLLAIDEREGGAYVPGHVRAITLTLPSGRQLRCASLPGLRRELTTLAESWDLPQDDEGLADVLRIAQDGNDGFVADLPEVLTFARLALAANEAVRKDCPLWLVGVEA
jgi:hypothetical protein